MKLSLSVAEAILILILTLLISFVSCQKYAEMQESKKKVELSDEGAE